MSRPVYSSPLLRDRLYDMDKEAQRIEDLIVGQGKSNPRPWVDDRAADAATQRQVNAEHDEASKRQPLTESEGLWRIELAILRVARALEK
ncbi:MAG: hypothetical protein K0U78_01935 [Actinomycetia bacterium]|nr:hypothetical protein [Actinomycetes bacterium]